MTHSYYSVALDLDRKNCLLVGGGEIEAKRGIPLSGISKIDTVHGKLFLFDLDGELLLNEPIRDFHGAMLKGCDECSDFFGHSADISVGSVGSQNGYSSILIHSESGLAAFAHASDRLEIRELDRPEALEKLNALDKRTAFGTLRGPFDPDAPLFIDYAEHLQLYDQTDRAPVAHDAVRY